jgi:hypothetical protein
VSLGSVRYIDLELDHSALYRNLRRLRLVDRIKASQESAREQASADEQVSCFT